MRTFVGYEWKDMEATGRRLVYCGETLEEAVANCLYTERLNNGKAFVGPTGNVVYNGNRRVVFPLPKRANA